MSRFAIGQEDFLLDGAPHRILSGALHYFRVHPDLWRDRIVKARQLGLNTIETYIPWNQHAPEPGVWIEDGRLDLGRFLDEVEAEGLHAIVRPGPYICAELDGGGLPAWLSTEPGVGVRRSEPRFLAAVGEYLEHALRIVAPRQIDAGGPVILVQVENEYGAYGADADYLDALTAMTREAGISVPLTTIDQPQPHMLRNGSRPGLHLTASFGSRSPERLSILREHQPTGPLMCMEYWDGWFDSWGLPHHTTSAAEAAADLDALLATGASVNLYMFHGGTNGLTSGANDKGLYVPIATSYDYDAPLDEAGDPTAKYWAFREVIGRYTALPEDVPAEAVPAPELSFGLAPAGFLVDGATLLPAIASDALPSVAELAHDAAFLLHEHRLRTDTPSVLTVGEVRDRVHVIVDGTVVGTLARDHHERAIGIPAVRGSLRLLVENQGRVNYGPRIGEDKGVIGGARLDGRALTGWTSRVLSSETLPTLATGAPAPFDAVGGPVAGPVFLHAAFTIEEEQPCGRHLATTSLGKGIVWVNGWCLGRYWSRGPQRTLYVPGPVLRAGRNEVLVLELDASPDARLDFVAAADPGWLDD